MKITVNEVREKSFVPVTINITLESEGELLTFWALANSSSTTIDTNARCYESMAKRIKAYRHDQSFRKNVPYSIFEKIDDIVTLRGLKY